MSTLYESYMFEQPIMMDTKAINPFYCELIIQVNGEKQNVRFANSKGAPQGPGVVTYTSVFASNGQKYAIDVSFKNNGTVHRIQRIYKNDNKLFF